MTTATVTITDAQKQQFRDEGYFILENIVPQEHLQLLRDECQAFIDGINAEMLQKGVTKLGINLLNSRYFIANTYLQKPEIGRFLFSDLMAEICRATLGDTVYLFNEQYVVKAAEKGMKFAWHQDSGYIGYPHKPYLSCWTPLDDVNEANGTIYVLPYDRAGTRERIDHMHDAETNDEVGYFGDDPGTPVIVPAGSIVVFSSFLLHRSGYNTTNGLRRVFLSQYSVEPIMSEDGKKIRNQAELFIENGETVRHT